MAPIPWGTEGGTYPPLLQMAGHGGAPWVEQKQTRNWPNCILTITKALTKTTNCTFIAKNWRGTTQKNFIGAPHLRFGPVPPPPLSNSFQRHCTPITYRLNVKAACHRTCVYERVFFSRFVHLFRRLRYRVRASQRQRSSAPVETLLRQRPGTGVRAARRHSRPLHQRRFHLQSRIRRQLFHLASVTVLGFPRGEQRCGGFDRSHCIPSFVFELCAVVKVQRDAAHAGEHRFSTCRKWLKALPTSDILCTQENGTLWRRNVDWLYRNARPKALTISNLEYFLGPSRDHNDCPWGPLPYISGPTTTCRPIVTVRCSAASFNKPYYYIVINLILNKFNRREPISIIFFPHGRSIAVDQHMRDWKFVVTKTVTVKCTATWQGGLCYSDGRWLATASSVSNVLRAKDSDNTNRSNIEYRKKIKLRSNEMKWNEKHGIKHRVAVVEIGSRPFLQTFACDAAECGGRLTEPSGTIQSALYPDRYHDNANCTWVITVPDEKLIKLRCAVVVVMALLMNDRSATTTRYVQSEMLVIIVDDCLRTNFMSSYSVAPTPWGTGEHVPPLLQMAWHGGAPWVEEQQTRNWPNCTDHHESAHQND